MNLPQALEFLFFLAITALSFWLWWHSPISKHPDDDL